LQGLDELIIREGLVLDGNVGIFLHELVNQFLVDLVKSRILVRPHADGDFFGDGAAGAAAPQLANNSAMMSTSQRTGE
jgi:hypothetical protein